MKTEFLNYYPLQTISDQNDFLGISPDVESGCIINTLSRNIVLRTQLNNQHQIQSWTATIATATLSKQVVYDHESSKYVGVFDNRFIRLWKQDAQNMKEGQKLKLTDPIEEIISFKNLYTILVYKNGLCGSLQNCQQPTAKIPIINEQRDQMINIACFNTLDNNVILTYFVRNKQTGDIEFVHFDLDPVTLMQVGKIHKIKIARQGSTATLAGFTVVEGDSFPRVMTIWSDKRIFMLPVHRNEPTDPSDVPGDFVAMFNDLKVDKPLSFVNVSTNCVAIYGGNTQQEGASLVLYNTLYHVVQCSLFFKVHLDNCRLWVIGNNILISVGQQLTCVPFRISEMRLSEMIASKRPVMSSSQIDKDSINEESELEECVSFDKDSQLLWNIDEIATPSKVPSKRTNFVANMITKKTSQPNETLETFVDDLRSLYCHDIPVTIVQSDSLLSELVQAKVTNHVKDQLYSIEEIALLTSKLEKEGASESEITEYIIPLLIKANLPNELAICLLKYTNVSDKMLAKSLKFYSTIEEEKLRNKFINRVLSCSFNESLIKEHLRTNLSLGDVIKLLEHIHAALNKHEIVLDETPQYGDNFDCDSRLINWSRVFLDAYYQQFILSRDPSLINLLYKWKTLTDEFADSIRDMKLTSAMLRYLVDGKSKISANPSSKRYSVEMVKLY